MVVVKEDAYPSERKGFFLFVTELLKRLNMLLQTFPTLNFFSVSVMISFNVSNNGFLFFKRFKRQIVLFSLNNSNATRWKPNER